MVPIDKDEFSWPLEKMARYPFLDDSKRYIKKEGPSIDELLNDRMWGMVRIRGKERVLESIREREVKIKNMSEDIDYEIELFSYPVSRILVSCVADPYLVRRYCLGEANKMHQELNKETNSDLIRLSNELGIKEVEALNRSDYDFKMHFTDYLENTNNLKAKEWKLINQDVRDGHVFLGKKKYIRILKESISERISEGLPRPINEKLIKRFDSEIKEIKHLMEKMKSEIEKVDMGRVEFDLFPPCIKKLISLQNEGENLSHEARFAVTAFLHKSGLSEKEIISVFSKAPDFKEDLAKYQIEHIIGDVSGTEYMVPNCNTMKTNGICYNPDSLCEQVWMSNPLIYYSFKKRKSTEGSKEKNEE